MPIPSEEAAGKGSVLAPLSVRPRERWTALGLFALTVLTTLAAGAFLSGADPFHRPGALLQGIPFAATLLAILGTHEFGHYWTARRTGIRATLPYFIPAPPPLVPLGTFGAVIRLRSPAPDRSALLRVAAAGPWAGMAVAIPVLLVGFHLSHIVSAPQGASQEFVTLGDSLLTAGIERMVFGALPAGQTLVLHPVAFAGWVGCLVTCLNLLPMTQLDGGHILYALVPRFHAWGGRLVALTLAVFGFLAFPAPSWFHWRAMGWPGWWIWAGIPLVLGFRHPPPLRPEHPLPRIDVWIGLASFVLLVLVFMPAPISLGGGG